MSGWLRIVAVALGLAAAVVIAAWIAGARLPEEHTAKVGAWYEVPPEAVWRAVTDVEHFAEWRSDVASVELHDRDDGRAAWTEVDGWGDRTAYLVIEARYFDHFVTKIDDESLPYGGTWTWHIEAQGIGTAVSITEDGFVRSAPMRAIATYWLGHTATMRKVLTDLGVALGHDPVWD